MASNNFRYNDTECPVCMETFKDPKQLPCTHTYCLQCIEKIVGESKSFPCPECKRDTTVPDRGLQAIPDNRYVHAILRVIEQAKKLQEDKLHGEKIRTDIGQQTEPICTTHKQPLLLYCNDSCQQVICALCIHKHKGHEIVEVAEKYIEVKMQINDVIDDAKTLCAKYSEYLKKLDYAEKEVKESAKNVIGEIDKRKEEMIKQIQDTTEDQKLEVLQIEQESTHTIQVAKVKLFGFVKLLSDFSTNSLTNIDTISRQELLTNKNDPADTLSTIKLGISSENVDIGIENVTYEHSDIPNQLELDYVGKIGRKMTYTQSGLTPITDIQSDVTPHFILQHKWSINHSIGYISYSNDKDYLLASGKHYTKYIIKCFTSKGQELWQRDTDEYIYGHAIVRDETEYLIAVKQHKLELLSLTDGKVLDSIELPFHVGCNGVCAVGDKSFLVVNSSIEPNTLAKFEIRNDKVVNMNTVINTDLRGIGGLYYGRERGEVCVTSWEENTIESIDYTNHEVKWKITGECQGRVIEPCGVTGDRRGNLYVADCWNERVLIIRDGVAITALQIPDTPYSIYDVCMSDYTDENPQLFGLPLNDTNNIIYVYQINYEI